MVKAISRFPMVESNGQKKKNQSLKLTSCVEWLIFYRLCCLLLVPLSCSEHTDQTNCYNRDSCNRGCDSGVSHRRTSSCCVLAVMEVVLLTRVKVSPTFRVAPLLETSLTSF